MSHIYVENSFLNVSIRPLMIARKTCMKQAVWSPLITLIKFVNITYYVDVPHYMIRFVPIITGCLYPVV